MFNGLFLSFFRQVFFKIQDLIIGHEDKNVRDFLLFIVFLFVFFFYLFKSR